MGVVIVKRSRVSVMATIQVGIPGAGGDIGYGADSVWQLFSTCRLPVSMPVQTKS
jgi:hypothetical protein